MKNFNTLETLDGSYHDYLWFEVSISRFDRFANRFGEFYLK